MISPLVSNSDPIEFNGLLDLQLKKTTLSNIELGLREKENTLIKADIKDSHAMRHYIS